MHWVCSVPYVGGYVFPQTVRSRWWSPKKSGNPSGEIMHVTLPGRAAKATHNGLFDKFMWHISAGKSALACILMTNLGKGKPDNKMRLQNPNFGLCVPYETLFEIEARVV